MMANLTALLALGIVVGALLMRVGGGEPAGRHSAYGRHRLDRQPVHAGYVGTLGPLAELAEQRGRHAT